MPVISISFLPSFIYTFIRLGEGIRLFMGNFQLLSSDIALLLDSFSVAKVDCARAAVIGIHCGLAKIFLSSYERVFLQVRNGTFRLTCAVRHLLRQHKIKSQQASRKDSRKGKSKIQKIIADMETNTETRKEQNATLADFVEKTARQIVYLINQYLNQYRQESVVVLQDRPMPIIDSSVARTGLLAISQIIRMAHFIELNAKSGEAWLRDDKHNRIVEVSKISPSDICRLFHIISETVQAE